MYVQVNIGRGFHPQGFSRCELSFRDWTRFTLDVEKSLIDFRNAMQGEGHEETNTVERHEGLGEYAGHVETSAHLSVLFYSHTRVDSIVEEYIRDLETDLQGIAQTYYQDSIALIIAGSYTNKGDRATLVYS